MAKDWIKDGYLLAASNSGALHGAQLADKYVKSVEKAIDVLAKDINHFSGFQTPTDCLQGDMAEFWHGDTFNINAAINESNLAATVDRSHGLASADVLLSDGTEVGLKFYNNAAASVNAQAKSYFQRFCEYRASSGRADLTLEQFLQEKGIDENVLATDPIYTGQVRLIPSDQYEAAVSYLKIKIQKELLTRPDEAKRYQETLDLLAKRIKGADGTESIELSREASQKLAELAKEGKFDPADFGISTEELMNFGHALAKGVKAGTSAAVITLILKTAPQLYKCLDELIVEGKVNEEDLRKLGFAALSGAGEGFVRGFVAGTIVTACESGIWGTALKGVSPGVVGALTAIAMQAMQDSFMVVNGQLTQQEFVANLSKNIFVASCGIGLGSAVAMVTACPFAYMLGNFVGSFVGSFAYVAVDSAFMSFAVKYGWTFFGVVKQDYELPDSVLQEIGVELFDYEKYDYDEYSFNEFEFDQFSIDEYHPHFISVVRRGVIGVHQVGYVVD